MYGFVLHLCVINDDDDDDDLVRYVISSAEMLRFCDNP